MRAEVASCPIQTNIAAAALTVPPSFAVPANFVWEPTALLIQVVSSATAGNRQLEFQVKTAAGVVVLRIVAGATQAASLTYKYQFGLGAFDLAAVRDTTFLAVTLPEVVIPSGYTLTVIDNKAIDAAGDTMAASLFVNQMPNP